MSDNLFDSFLKEKLQNHVSPVADDMWQRIQAKKEKERRGFWWNNYRNIGLALVGVALVSTLLIMQPFNNDAGEINNHQPNKTNTALATPGINNQASKTSGAANNLNDKNELLVNDESGMQQNNSVTSKETPGNFSGAQADQSKLIPANGGHLYADKNPTKQPINYTIVEHGIRTADNTSRSEKQDIDNDLQAGKSIAINENANAFRQNKATNAEDFITINALQFLAGKKAAGKVFQLNKNIEWLKGIKLTDCPSAFGNRKSNWYVEAFVSPDYSIKRTRNSGVNEEYIKRKDSTESYNGAFTAGIRLSTTIGEHLLLKSGLQYSQINEKFNYRSENERRLTTVVTIRTIIRGPGDTLTVRDTSIVEQIGYRVKTTYNRYRSFDIPVILGYEWGNDEWRGSVNAGVIFNIRSWQQGDMLDTSYTPVSFDKTSSPIFKHNIGLGVYAGASLIKPLGNKLDVFAEPYMRYNISSMTNSNSPFNQKFHIIGINFGVRYKIAGNRQQ